MKRLTNLVIKKILTVVFYLFRVFPINKKKIVITNFNGRGFGDSAKYIVEELNKIDNKLKIVWVVSKYYEDMPQYIKQVKIYTIKWIYQLVSAKVWINNSRFSYYVKKRKKQYYIQVWHGGLALKKVEFDVYTPKDRKYWKIMINDNKNIDLMVSNSSFCTKMYRNAFKYNGKILELGTPRNDILIKNDNNVLNKVHKCLNINMNKKILLYAPTFRDDYKCNPYDINFKIVADVIEEITNSKWQIVIKLHPNIKNSSKLVNNSNIINASNYSDMQELILACDMLITDYSSTMFESLIANKPVIIYAKDIEIYKKARGYYFKFDELPFPIAKDNEELRNILEHQKLFDIVKNYDEFKKNVGLKEKGDSSIQVAKIIERICNDNH